MSQVARIAVCQLACHPAFYIAHQRWLEEPYVPEDPELSLSTLLMNGIAVDSLLEKCLEKYIRWHRERLASILDHLLELDKVPDLLMFSEGAVPYQCLDILKTFNLKKGTTIFAGTHTPQNLKEAKKCYSNLGIRDKTLARLFSRNNLTNAVAPLFINDKVHLVEKQISSPFEKSDVSNFNTSPKPMFPFLIKLNDKKLNILVLICAEALNFPKLKVKGDYDIVAVLSHDNNPNHFDNVLDILVSNGKMIIYCNDGRYGGSRIGLPIDKRMSLWWFKSYLQGKLPKGESLLVADIDCEHLKVQVGTTEPSANFKLIKLQSIVYSEDDVSSHASLALNDISTLSDSGVKVRKLRDLVDSKVCDSLQSIKLNYLYTIVAKGQAVEQWWDVLGQDLILKLPSLQQLEKELCSECCAELSDALIELDSSEPGFGSLKGFLKAAKEISGKTRPKKSGNEIQKNRFNAIINRDEDAKAIVSFFDNDRQRIAQISGMEQIGKSAVISKALQQCRYGKIVELNVQETSSADFILSKLFYSALDPTSFEYSDLSVTQKHEAILNVLGKIDVLWIHNSERLVANSKWRNDEISIVIKKLIEGANNSNCKITDL